jgi:hypothetical protein
VITWYVIIEQWWSDEWLEKTKVLAAGRAPLTLHHKSHPSFELRSWCSYEWLNYNRTASFLPVVTLSQSFRIILSCSNCGGLVLCDFRTAWRNGSVARSSVSGTDDLTWPQHVLVALSSEVPTSLWSAWSQDPVSPSDLRRRRCCFQSSANSERSRPGQKAWQSSAADEQVDSWVQPYISGQVSAQFLGVVLYFYTVSQTAASD